MVKERGVRVFGGVMLGRWKGMINKVTCLHADWRWCLFHWKDSFRSLVLSGTHLYPWRRLCKCEFSFPKRNFSCVFRASPESAIAQNNQLKKIPYAKEGYFGALTSAFLHQSEDYTKL